MQYVIILSLDVAIGCSPFRNSGLVNLLINITGGYYYGFCGGGVSCS